jgi:hypothetical protein
MHVNTCESLKRIVSFNECRAKKTGVLDTSYGGHWRCLYAVVTQCDGARNFGRWGLHGGRQVALQRDSGDGT